MNEDIVLRKYMDRVIYMPKPNAELCNYCNFYSNADCNIGIHVRSDNITKCIFKINLGCKSGL